MPVPVSVMFIFRISLPQNQWFKFDLPLFAYLLFGYAEKYGPSGIAGFFVGLLQKYFLTGVIFGFHILTGCDWYMLAIQKEKVFKDSMFYNIVRDCYNNICFARLLFYLSAGYYRP